MFSPVLFYVWMTRFLLLMRLMIWTSPWIRRSISQLAGWSRWLAMSSRSARVGFFPDFMISPLCIYYSNNVKWTLIVTMIHFFFFRSSAYARIVSTSHTSHPFVFASGAGAVPRRTWLSSVPRLMPIILAACAFPIYSGIPITSTYETFRFV